MAVRGDGGWHLLAICAVCALLMTLVSGAALPGDGEPTRPNQQPLSGTNTAPQLAHWHTQPVKRASTRTHAPTRHKPYIVTRRCPRRPAGVHTLKAGPERGARMPPVPPAGARGPRTDDEAEGEHHRAHWHGVTAQRRPECTFRPHSL